MNSSHNSELSLISHVSDFPTRPLQDTRSLNASNVSLSSLGNESVGGSKRPCAYFLQGTCRNGDRCRFSHSGNVSPHDGESLSPRIFRESSFHQNPLGGSIVDYAQYVMNPVTISIPPDCPVYSIDVECVATGVQHNARSVAQVALVNQWGAPILNVLIQQDKPVFSYLTPLTGLTKEAIDTYGIPLADAMVQLRAYLPPNAILVGQNIQCDVQWLQLAEGVDYHSFIDLSTLFRVWDSSKGAHITFSQDHCASVWMGMQRRTHHDAVTDATISIGLFNTYRQIQWDPVRLRQMQIATLSAPRIPGFSSLYPILDNCCMGNRRKCVCGAPFR